MLAYLGGINLEQAIKKTFELEEINANQYSPLVLAYMGDCAYEIVIRTLLLHKGNTHVDRLNKRASNLAKAGTQAQMIMAILDNLSEEDKEFFSEETKAMSEIAPLYNILHKCLKDNTTLIEKIIFFKYFLYETDEPFMPQFKRNNRVLKDELERIINKYTDIYGG